LHLADEFGRWAGWGGGNAQQAQLAMFPEADISAIYLLNDQKYKNTFCCTKNLKFTKMP